MSRDFNEISDGRFYDLNDMVKVGCKECEGCYKCCTGMGESILLDPFDIFLLTSNLKLTFEQLLEHYLELNVVDGIILPNMKMAGKEERCSFLNEEGRCSIHSFRPSICRLFPLGRIYENHSFRYFLQTKECVKENRTKIKVSKWIDIKDGKENQRFIIEWHYLLKEARRVINDKPDRVKEINYAFLQIFFQKPYDIEPDFYTQFHNRHQIAKQRLEDVYICAQKKTKEVDL